MVVGEGRYGRRWPSAGARKILVGRLRARHGEIEEEIFARIRDERFESTGDDDAEYLAGLRAATVAALEHVLNGIERGGVSSEPAPAAALVQARRAARSGVGLDTVLRRYIAGYALLEGFIVREVARCRSLGWGAVMLRDVLGGAGELVERLIGAVSEAYRLESARAGGDRTSRSVSVSGVAAVSGGAVLPQTGSGQGGPEARSRRERIMAAIVEVVAERGYAGASVGVVIERAGVSRRTFYEAFPGGMDDGLIAVMDWGLERSGALIAERLEQAGSWQEGVRGALAALLVFLDGDPALARVCLVETLAGSAGLVEHRQRNLRAFRGLIVARIEREGVPVPPLAAESAMASIMGVIYNRILAREPTPLIELLGPLMGTTVTPFVASDELALEEKRLGDQLVRAIQDGDPEWAVRPAALTSRARVRGMGRMGREDGEDEAAGASSATPRGPGSRRAHECVLYLAEHPDASNGEIAAGIGIAHRSQVSRLLSELAKEGLVLKSTEGVGRRNAWRLTARGEEIVRTFGERGV
jgi:AcrR family transcriptional regulator/DNA-binding transcriptional ArsR family regulator